MSADDNSPLYRQEALDAQKVSVLGQIIIRPPRATRLLTFCCVLLACLLILFIFLGRYTKKSTVIGEVMPHGGAIKVFSVQPGRVVEQYCTEGELVAQGQPLFLIDSDLETDEGKTQLRIIDNLQSQRQALADEALRLQDRQVQYEQQWASRVATLQSQLTVLQRQFPILGKQLAMAEESEQHYQNLLTQGHVTKEQYKVIANKQLELALQLEQLNKEASSLEQRQLELDEEQHQQLSLIAQQKSKIAQQQASIDNQLVSAQARQESLVRAPQAGLIGAMVASTGQYVDRQRPLLSLVPEAAVYEVHLYADSSRMGFVKPGDEVFLRYQAYPYQKFGQYKATVSEVARVALPGGEMSDLLRGQAATQSLYQIRATLDQQYIDAYGVQQPLVTGMQVEADIVLETRHIYEWIIDPLLSITQKW